MTKKAFLYCRFSTIQQGADGRDSLRRQTKTGLEYAEKNKFDVIELTDKGISAFKKDRNNAKIGKMADLLAKADAGTINGCALIVESLDRVSRQSPLDALADFTRLLKGGVEVHTIGDGQIYTRASIDENHMQLFQSLVIMSRANEESATKSKRIKSLIKAKRENVKKGGIWKGSRPSWIGRKHDKYFLIEERAEVLRRIFRLTLEGWGNPKIAKTLNNEGVSTFYTNRVDPEKPFIWQPSQIKKYLASKACYGVFELDGVEYPDFFPKVIDKETYDRVRAIKVSRNKPTRGRKTHTNPFNGVLKCGCSGCNKGMHLAQLNHKTLGKYFLYRCAAKASDSCANPTVKKETLKKAILDVLKFLDYEDLNAIPVDDVSIKLKEDIAIKRGEIITIKEQIEKNHTLAENSKYPDRFIERIDTLMDQERMVLSEISILQEEIDSVVPIKKVEPLNYLSEVPEDKLNEVIKSQIEEISIESIRYKPEKKNEREKIKKRKQSKSQSTRGGKGRNFLYERYITILFHSGHTLEAFLNHEGEYVKLDSRPKPPHISEGISQSELDQLRDGSY